MLCITSSCITTQHPDSLTITNKWDFTADTDIDGVSAPSSNAEEQEFVLSVRQDKKVPVPVNPTHIHECVPVKKVQHLLMSEMQSKFKAVKFTCKQRSSLLTMLYQAMASAAMHGQCPIASRILG